MADTSTGTGGWILVSVSTATGAASLRVTVWRKLRALGALYLQQSVALLPARPAVVHEARRLANRVRREGGTARILALELIDAAEERAVVDELNAARESEYDELLDRLPEVRRELTSERQKGNLTYAEVEESEADLERFRRWYAKIAARDYFATARAADARAAIEDVAAELADFEAAALEADPLAGADPNAAVSRLRAVGGNA